MSKLTKKQRVFHEIKTVTSGEMRNNVWSYSRRIIVIKRNWTALWSYRLHALAHEVLMLSKINIVNIFSHSSSIFHSSNPTPFLTLPFSTAKFQLLTAPKLKSLLTFNSFSSATKRPFFLLWIYNSHFHVTRSRVTFALTDQPIKCFF